MNRKNYSARKKIPDCWNARLLNNAEYLSELEFPYFPAANSVPQEMLSFKNITPYVDNTQWIHFYGNDDRLEHVWENPEIWASKLKRFSGVISPDLSIYRDMPIPQQFYNVYRNRVLVHYFTQQGISVIPNIRWGDERSYKFAFEGITERGTVCISTFGIIADGQDREYFKRGLAEMLHRLSPSTVLVYGQMPSNIFDQYQNNGVRFVHFDADTQKAHTYERREC